VLAPTLTVFLAVRALVGVGEASYAVVTRSLLGRLYPVERRGRAMSMFTRRSRLGGGGLRLGGVLGQHLGWRPAFFFAGGPGVLLAVALLFLERPRAGAHDAPQEKAEHQLSIAPR